MSNNITNKSRSEFMSVLAFASAVMLTFDFKHALKAFKSDRGCNEE